LKHFRVYSENGTPEFFADGKNYAAFGVEGYCPLVTASAVKAARRRTLPPQRASFHFLAAKRREKMV
jgi:hypothetical protein